MDLETLLWRKFWLDHGGADFRQRGEVLKLCLNSWLHGVSAHQRGEVFHLANKVYYYTAVMKPIRLCNVFWGSPYQSHEKIHSSKVHMNCNF